MEAGALDIDPEDEDLHAELLEHHYSTNSTGQIQLESKEDIAQRLGRSPDRADAFVMSLQKTATLRKFAENIERQKQTQNATQNATNQNQNAHDREPEDLAGDIMESKL